MLLAVEEFEIDFPTHPCIGSRVHALRLVQFGGFPVGKLLGFGDAQPENVCGKLLDALVAYAPFPGNLLQVDKTGRGEFTILLETADVVENGRSDLDYILVRKDAAKRTAHSQALDPEEKSLFGT